MLYIRDKSNTKLIGKAITKGMGKVSGKYENALVMILISDKVEGSLNNISMIDLSISKLY